MVQMGIPLTGGMVYFALSAYRRRHGRAAMSFRIHPAPVVVLALAIAAPAFAQTDPAIQRIRDRGVSANNAAEQMVDADAAQDRSAEAGEQRVRDERDAPEAAAPLPEGEIEVGDVETGAALEPGEEPDPAADAEESFDDDLPEL
jgi:hypothetical protein